MLEDLVQIDEGLGTHVVFPGFVLRFTGSVHVSFPVSNHSNCVCVLLLLLIFFFYVCVKCVCVQERKLRFRLFTICLSGAHDRHRLC